MTALAACCHFCLNRQDDVHGDKDGNSCNKCHSNYDTEVLAKFALVVLRHWVEQWPGTKLMHAIGCHLRSVHDTVPHFGPVKA